MSEQRLLDLGAECVCGDLILRHTVVGHYRHGNFLPTPEGLDILENEIEAEVVEVVTKPAAKKAKAKVEAIEAPAEPTEGAAPEA